MDSPSDDPATRPDRDSPAGSRTPSGSTSPLRGDRADADARARSRDGAALPRGRLLPPVARLGSRPGRDGGPPRVARRSDGTRFGRRDGGRRQSRLKPLGRRRRPDRAAERVPVARHVRMPSSHLVPLRPLRRRLRLRDGRRPRAPARGRSRCARSPLWSPTRECTPGSTTRATSSPARSPAPRWLSSRRMRSTGGHPSERLKPLEEVREDVRVGRHWMIEPGWCPAHITCIG